MTTILLTGNRSKNKKGISFFEVMVTLAVLSVGLIAIYQSFFISLDYINHLNSRLQANLLMDNNLAELQQYFLRHGQVPYKLTIDEANSPFLKDKNRKYSYNRNINSIAGIDSILQVDMFVSWMERGRQVTLSKSGYIFYFGDNRGKIVE